MLSRLPRRGGGAGGAFSFWRVDGSTRDTLDREALDEVRCKALPILDVLRRGGGGGMLFGSAAIGAGDDDWGGVSAVDTDGSDAGLVLREGGGGGGTAVFDVVSGGFGRPSSSWVEFWVTFEALRERPGALAV